MAPRRTLSPAPLFDSRLLFKAFEEQNVKELHAYKLWGQAIRKPHGEITDVVDLPKAAADMLTGDSPMFARFTSKVTLVEESSDRLTTKLKIRLQDGLEVETVIMRWDPEQTTSATGIESDTESIAAGRNPSDRATVCVSSQVGCQMGCTFCATGTMGLIGNLLAGEIAEQLLHARQYCNRIRNVVFMGMGLSARHVTVSTVGVIPRIRSMHTDLPGVSLALSLHAPNQDLRKTIVPSAKAYPIDRLMEAVAEYQTSSGQKVFVEYVVLSGINDGLEEAKQLGELLQDRNVTLNLIPWNPVYSPASSQFGFQAPSRESLAEFQHCLRHEYGVFTTVRQEKGQEISGACGQLVIQSAGLEAPRGVKQAGGLCSGGLKDIEELASATLEALKL